MRDYWWLITLWMASLSRGHHDCLCILLLHRTGLAHQSPHDDVAGVVIIHATTQAGVRRRHWREPSSEEIEPSTRYTCTSDVIVIWFQDHGSLIGRI